MTTGDCSEEAQASHLERQQEETPRLASPMSASCFSCPIPGFMYVNKEPSPAQPLAEYYQMTPADAREAKELFHLSPALIADP